MSRTARSVKALQITDNAQKIVAIELLAACQSYDLLGNTVKPATRTFALYKALRGVIAVYADVRPLGADIAAAAEFIAERTPDGILSLSGLSLPEPA
jgi:histidine ammonia-lyase